MAETDYVISSVQEIYNRVLGNLVVLKREREEVERNTEDDQPAKKASWTSTSLRTAYTMLLLSILEGLRLGGT